MQKLGQRWVGLELLAARRCWRADIGPTLVQHLSFNSWSAHVGPTTVLQRTNAGFRVEGPMLAQHMLADCKRNLFLNIKFILNMKNYIIYFLMKTLNFFYNNNFSIYLIILNDFDNLKLDKILEYFVLSLWIFCKNLWLYIERQSYITKWNFR